MKKSILFAVAGLSSLAVLGCGTSNTGTSSGSSSSSSSGQNITLTMWDLTNSQAADSAIISQFEKQNPNITIKLTTYSTDGIKQQEKVAGQSHSLPDIFFNWGGSLASYYDENGLALNLDKYASEYNWNSRFAGLSLTQYNGHQYMVPAQLNGLELYYRKDIFQKYGLSVPTTFSELEHDCDVLVKNGVSPFGLGGINHWYTQRYFNAILYHYTGMQEHEQLMDLKANWNSPAVVQAYQTFQSWVQKGYFVPGFMSINEDQDINQFMSGKAAMLLTGPWLDEQLVADKFDLSKTGVFQFPEDQKPNELISFAQGYYISANSKYPDAAAKFLNYYTSNAVIKKNETVMQGPFANKNVPPNTPNAAQILKDLNTNGGFLITDQKLPQQVVQNFWQAEDSVAIGKMTPQQAAQYMQQSVQSYNSQNQ